MATQENPRTFEAVLRDAFDAGRARGAEENGRGVHPEIRLSSPDFEEWRRTAFGDADPQVNFHRCDERCVCHEHEEPKPLRWWPKGNEHACSDPDCVNAHGMVAPLLRGVDLPD